MDIDKLIKERRFVLREYETSFHLRDYWEGRLIEIELVLSILKIPASEW